MAEAIVGALAYIGITTTAAAVTAVATTIAIGIAVGAVVGAVSAIVTGGDILSGALKGALIGGVSAGIFSAASAAVSAVMDVGVDASVSLGSEVSAGAFETLESGIGAAEGAATVTNMTGLMAPDISANMPAPQAPTPLAPPPVVPPSGSQTPTPPAGAPTTAAGMSDATAKIYAGIGQGAAQGLGEVGKSMMQADSAEKLREQEKADEAAKQAAAYSTTPYKIASPISGFTQDPSKMAKTASAQTSDVSAQLQAQTANISPSVAIAQQTANVTQPEQNWWLSHIQAPIPQSKQGPGKIGV